MKSSVKLFATDRLFYIFGLIVILLSPSSLNFINSKIARVKASLQANYHYTASFTTTPTIGSWNVSAVTDLRRITVGKPVVVNSKNVANVVVLVHGFMGNSKELLHMEQTLKNIGEKRRDDTKSEEWIVHSATCNEYSTFDGIVAGGKRLANEINQLLDNVKSTNPGATKVTLSIVGSSLGGLYSRYAVSEINFQNIIPISFTTIATPHLGVDGNTYIPISRSIEYVIARIMSQTGLDLFRFSTVIDQLTIDDKFLNPLQLFHHRRSYANAYHTDHVVPLRTAAFLSSSNTNTNHIVHPSKTVLTHNSTTTATKAGHNQISIMVETLQQKRNVKSCTTSTGSSIYNFTTNTCTYNSNSKVMDDHHNANRLTLDDMAVRLDTLGWTKVLCDIRDVLPPIPKSLFTKSSSWSFTTMINVGGISSLSNRFFGMISNEPKLSETRESNKVEKSARIIQSEQGKKIFSSSELLKLYGMMSNDRLVIPIGHSMLGAHAHFSFFGYINSGGRPIIETMSNDIIQQIERSTTNTVV
jgi:triacylglycerol esterase/lipase EstA (alpha/beta hydrolase family)